MRHFSFRVFVTRPRDGGGVCLWPRVFAGDLTVIEFSVGTVSVIITSLEDNLKRENALRYLFFLPSFFVRRAKNFSLSQYDFLFPFLSSRQEIRYLVITSRSTKNKQASFSSREKKEHNRSYTDELSLETLDCVSIDFSTVIAYLIARRLAVFTCINRRISRTLLFLYIDISCRTYTKIIVSLPFFSESLSRGRRILNDLPPLPLGLAAFFFDRWNVDLHVPVKQRRSPSKAPQRVSSAP